MINNPAQFATGEFTFTTTGNIDDLDFQNKPIIRCNNAAIATIRGLKAGSPGQKVTLVAVGASIVFFAHENTGSSAPNRLTNIVSSGLTPIVSGGVATYEYDSITQRWRIADHIQGNYVGQGFSAGDYTGGSGMTWTPDSGDLKTYQYYLSGKVLEVLGYWDTTTVSGGQLQLFVAIPGGYTSIAIVQASAAAFDNGVGTFAYNRVGFVDFTRIEIGRGDATNWAASVNNTYIRVNIRFPVS